MLQKIATRVFMITSIVFGVVGISLVLTSQGPDTEDSDLTILLMKLLMACVFIILPSFALSVAAKYLNGKP